ncbi:MAG: hypothetical protein ABJ275_07195 [Maricaulaceae bacterium]
MAAITTLGLISGVGLSVDGQRLYTHSDKVQSIADSIGLAAALHVSSSGEIPTEAGPGVFIAGQTYSARDLGYPLDSGENIFLTVEYDGIDREVTVRTEGTIEPIMLQIIGKKTIKSNISTTVKYTEPDILNAASILFVLDNSGSMLFDDKPLTIDIDDYSHLSSYEQTLLNYLTWGWLNSESAKFVTDYFSQENTTPRVDALKLNMTTFNTQLTKLINDSKASVRFLRTGIVTYNNNIVRESAMKWGALDQVQDIDNMSPINGTNSSVAFTKAVQDFADEDQKHLTENGSLDPTKYLVFMSDGQNTDSSNLTSWIAVPNVDSTGLFRIYREAVCTRYWRSGRCRTSTSAGYEEWDVDIHGVGTGAKNPNEAGLSGNWEEGRYVSPGDAATIADCKTLKDQGVTIFTIGFALESGTFDTNTWADLYNPYRSYRQISDIEDESLERAFALLDACATDDSTFLLANDANDLTIAFKQIQAQLSSELVRLSE